MRCRALGIHDSFRNSPTGIFYCVWPAETVKSFRILAAVFESAYRDFGTLPTGIQVAAAANGTETASRRYVFRRVADG
jgi:hypothetical protein